MSGHTPGPWEVEDYKGQVMVACGDPCAEWICEVMGGYSKANAQLIAAAPDGVELDTTSILFIDEYPHNPHKRKACLQAAKEFLAKATREEE